MMNRPPRGLLRRTSSLLPGVLMALLLGCGDDGSVDPVDPDLEPLVGEWSATSLVHTSREEPNRSLDLIDAGATFTLEIRNSGRYQAELNIAGNPFFEEGVASVEGQELLLLPDGADEPERATFALDGNRLTLDGESNFNFPGDGDDTRVPTDLHIELVKRR